LNIAASLAQLNVEREREKDRELREKGGEGGKRRGSVLEGDERKVEGREIQQDHAQYALTYGMMLGIRVCVSY
jgi:hypothetical protein